MGGEELDNRILVAGGGGGSCTSNLNGGTGGGGHVTPACNGGNGNVYSGSDTQSAGATQNSGNALGVGQNGRNTNSYSYGAEGNGGGGGGYYGGLSKQNAGSYCDAAGGGGSSFVDTSRFTASGGANGSDATYGRSGNGQARITWAGW
jgi:hypothetical protein